MKMNDNIDYRRRDPPKTPWKDGVRIKEHNAR